MSVESELKSAFTEVGAQMKTRTKAGTVDSWGLVPIAVINSGATLPTPLPSLGIVVELDP